MELGRSLQCCEHSFAAVTLRMLALFGLPSLLPQQDTAAAKLLHLTNSAYGQYLTPRSSLKAEAAGELFV